MQKTETILIPIKDIYPNDSQPRKTFDEKKLEDLSQSIKLHGIIQPIVVQKKMDKFMIIAGERRYRASTMAGLERLPCVVWSGASQKGLMEVALVENIQRENLNPVEEALAYKNLCENYGLTQEQIATAVGKSRPYITNAIRLLNLSQQVVQLLREGKISAGHGKALLKMERGDMQIKIAQKIIREGLSVRATEDIINALVSKSDDMQMKNVKTDPFIKDMQESLISILGTKVNIIKGKKRGKIEIEYYSEEELEHIVSTIMGD